MIVKNIIFSKETGKHMENQKGEATKADMALDVDKKGTKDKVTMKKNINVLHGTCFIVSTIIGTGKINVTMTVRCLYVPL